MPHDDDSTISLNRPVSGEESAATVEIPKAIGSLELVQELGKGGMGVVWLARDTILSRDVAVKFLIGSAAKPADPHFTQFVQGAKAAAQVRCEGLTAIHHADLVQGIPYLVMEYIAGPSLSEVLRAGGPMPVNAAVWVVSRVCETLALLHDHEVVHRDLKPGNILMDAVRGPVVTDFGLSLDRIHAMGRGIDVGDRVAGTPEYMAPEMWLGEVSARTDVYALGVTLFELLAGAKPFKGSIPALRNAHTILPPPLSDLASRQTPQDLMDVIDRAMHKDAKLRYRGPRRLAEALLQVVPGEQARRQGESHVNEIAARLRSPTKPAWDSQVYTVPQTRTPSTYYERLGQIASKRRMPATDEPAAPINPRTAADQIGIDLPCVTCDYSLKGLTGRDRCPECGESVEPSLDRRRLILADRRWLARVRRGTVSLIWFTLLAVLAQTVVTMTLGVPSTETIKRFSAVVVVIGVTGMLVPIALAMNTYWATRPPPESAPMAGGRARIAARRLMIGAAVLAAISGISYAAAPALQVGSWMSLATWIALGAGFVALALYLCTLVAHADKPRASIAAWGCAGVTFITVPVVLLGQVMLLTGGLTGSRRTVSLVFILVALVAMTALIVIAGSALRAVLQRGVRIPEDRPITGLPTWSGAMPAAVLEPKPEPWGTPDSPDAADPRDLTRTDREPPAPPPS